MYYQCVLVVMCLIFLGYNPVITLFILLLKLGTDFIFQELLVTLKLLFLTFFIVINQVII